MKLPCRLEEVEQADVVQYLTLKKIRFHASPNGARMAMKQALKMKQQGCSPGFPDLIIFPLNAPPIAIEMKRVKGGKVSPEQVDWLSFLECQGWRVDICKGSGEAIDFLRKCGI